MTSIFYMFLLVFSLFLSGCRCERQASGDKAPEKEICRKIQIHNLKVTKETLMLDYQVTNTFAYEIWICEDIDIYGPYDVETRIDSETVWIKLRFNLETNILLEEGLLAKYRCLSPGQSHSGKILLNLPIRNASPVYDFDDDRKKHKQVFLKCVVFEVGYFEGKHINRISEALEKFKSTKSSKEIQNTRFNPRIETEIQDGKSYKFLYCTNYWPGLNREKTAKVIVTDNDILCSVAIDDR